MNNNRIITKIFVFLLLATTAILFEPSFCYAAHARSHQHTRVEIQKKRKQTREKIHYLKWLENLETNKLYKNQQRLEDTSATLAQSRQQLGSAQGRLNLLQSQLSKSLAEFSMINFQMKRQIVMIFKNQRKGLFELLLSAKDFNTFLDRVYFEGIVIRNDYKKMELARKKAKEIASLKYNIEEQRRYLDRSIKNIHFQQQNIQQEIAKNHNMIYKLRTDRATYERAERELARQSASLENMINRSTSGRVAAPMRAVSTGFIKPIGGGITSPFGWRRHPIFNSRSFHSGVDIGGPFNGSVRASNSGRVIYSGWYGGYGKVVILDHGRINGVPVTTLYAHLNSSCVCVGENVSRGDVVGHEGTTGYSTGPHVHFEVRVNGRPNNPLNYI